MMLSAKKEERSSVNDRGCFDARPELVLRSCGGCYHGGDFSRKVVIRVQGFARLKRKER